MRVQRRERQTKTQATATLAMHTAGLTAVVAGTLPATAKKCSGEHPVRHQGSRWADECQ